MPKKEKSSLESLEDFQNTVTKALEDHKKSTESPTKWKKVPDKELPKKKKG